MLDDPKKYLDLVTINKDRNLGKYEREMSEAYFQDLLQRSIEDTLSKEQVTEMFDEISKFLKTNEFKEDLTDMTNLEVHFVIQAQSVIQYISPYTMDYNVGRTRKLIKETVVWSLRPDAITLGYHHEITNNKGRNHSLVEKNEHVDGSCKEWFNVIALHTYENYEQENYKTSTMHVVVYTPVGSMMMNSIVALYQKQQQDRMKNITKKDIKKMEAQNRRKKGKMRSK